MIVSPAPRWQVHPAMESGEIPEARNGQRRTAQPAASCASPNSKIAAGTTKQRRANRAVLLLLLGAGVVLYSSNSLLLILAKGQNNSHFKFHLSSVILLSEVLRGFGAFVLVAIDVSRLADSTGRSDNPGRDFYGLLGISWEVHLMIK